MSAHAAFNTEALSALIEDALKQEEKHHLLANLIRHRLDDISRIIRLPDNDPVMHLCQYVVDYIRYLPAMLNDLDTAATQTGMTAVTDPVIRAAQQFLLTPPAELEKETGLIALMDEAYLAFRLLEEVNESCIHRIGQPLIPLDMCLSNIMIHTLIGEPFANELDAMVELRVERLFEKRRSYEDTAFGSFMQRLKSADVAHLGQRWSCFSSQLGCGSALL